MIDHLVVEWEELGCLRAIVHHVINDLVIGVAARDACPAGLLLAGELQF